MVDPSMLERRNSVTSLAPSEGSRSELATRRQNTEVVQQPKNYYKQVSDNKEIAKLVSLLATAINSTKRVSILYGCLLVICTIKFTSLFIVTMCSYSLQGSYSLEKSWKTLEFQCCFFKRLKVLDFRDSP